MPNDSGSDERGVWATLEHLLLDGDDARAFRSCAAMAAELAGADEGLLYVVDHERPWLEALFDADSAWVAPNEPLAKALFDRMDPQAPGTVVHDTTLDARSIDGDASLLPSKRLRAFACIPLRGVTPDCLGALIATCRAPRVFEEEDLALLRAAAKCIGLHLELRLCALRLGATTRKLRDERGRLERDARGRGESTQLLVHDLKNPLTVISLAAESVKADSNPIVRRAFEDILAASDVARRLVHDMLDLGRDGSRPLTLERARVDMRALAERMIGRLGSLAAIRHHRLLVTCGLGDAVVVGDAFLLERLLRNLVDNALKYAPPSSLISIAIESRGTRLAVRVTDGGETIEPKLRSVIFQQDTRVLSSERGSHGLGLKLCKVVADLHGGSIYVEDAGLDGGNTFCVELPRAD